MLDLEPLSFPFGRDQCDYLPFRTIEGFAAVRLDLIEGFCANSDGSSAVVVRDQAGAYNTPEPVPVLVRRAAFLLNKGRDTGDHVNGGSSGSVSRAAEGEDIPGNQPDGAGPILTNASVTETPAHYRVQVPRR